MVYYLHLVVGKYTIHGSYGKIGEYKHPKSQGRRTPQSLSGFLLPICVLFPVVTFSKNLVRCFDTFPASNEELNHKSSLSKNPKNLWKNGYPSSHDHGSGQLLRKLLLEGPIFPLLPWLWEESKSHVCSKLWFSPAHRSPQSVEGVPGHILLTNEMYCTENQKARWQVPQPFHKHNIQQFQDNDVQPCGTCTLEIHLSDINKYQQNTTYLIPEFLNICNMDSWWHGTCRKMDFRYNMQVFKPFFVVGDVEVGCWRLWTNHSKYFKLEGIWEVLLALSRGGRVWNQFWWSKLRWKGFIRNMVYLCWTRIQGIVSVAQL